MRIKQTKVGYTITLDKLTKEINIITPCIINTINQDHLDRIYINISKQ